MTSHPRALGAAFLLLASGCAGPAASDRAGGAVGAGETARATLFPICVGNRFGFIDRNGAVVVPPKLGMIDETLGELTMVWVVLPVPPGEGKPEFPPPARAGFVDTRGRFAVEPIYEEAHPFSEGLAGVKRGGKWGYADGKGTIRIPLRFENAQPFSEGLALVKDEAGERFIDTSGRTVIDLASIRWLRGGKPLPVVADGPFSDGLAAFRVILRGENPDVLVGFMDRRGRIVIEPAFTYAYAFHGGHAKVRVACATVSGGRCEGIVGREGVWVIPPTHEFLAPFDGGLANFTALVGKQHLHGFLDERNEVVIPPRYEHSCLWFAEGLCETKIGKRWAYVDRSGAEVVVLPKDTTNASQFSGGLAQVTTPRGDHFVRRDGLAAFPGEFKNARRFRNGLAYVQFKDGGEGYIDLQGRVVYRQSEPCKPW